jgi:hypothetical protein
MEATRPAHARRWVTVLLAAGMLVTALSALPAGATAGGNTEACTPGYWKNHTDNWLEEPGVLIPTSKTLGSAFGSLYTYWPDLADDTFLDALNYNSFQGTEGKVRNLLKHAVAAFLNAAYDDAEGHLLYPLRRNGQGDGPAGFQGIIPEVDQAIASGNNGTILGLKDLFDSIANDLPCPLN